MSLNMPGGIHLPGKSTSAPGQNGHSPEITADDEAIRWKLDNETVWRMLLPRSAINGKDGEHGEDGKDGKDGLNGRSLEMRVSSGFLQSRLEGDTTWSTLIAIPKDGANGKDGKDGTNGTNGSNGNTILSGTSDPTAATGVNGDFYINRASLTLFGPKANGAWPAGASLRGNNGANATTTETATGQTNGLMAATDKAKLDGINNPSAAVIASGGRPIGTAFTVHATRNARVSYTIGYTLAATLTLGQTIVVTATVDGVEVARISDGILLGLAGSVTKNQTLSFFVPAGKAVLLTKTGTASVAANVVAGQETLL